LHSALQSYEEVVCRLLELLTEAAVARKNMTTYVYRNGEMVEKALAEPLYSGFNYISDHMDPLLHHAAMRVIDSKSEFRKETKAHGCIEVGSQQDYGQKRLFTPRLDNRERREDIQKAVYQLKNGHRG